MKNEIFYSECIVGAKQIHLPDKKAFTDRQHRYNIHFYVESGPIQVWYDSKNNTPSLKLYDKAKWNAKFNDSESRLLIIEPLNTLKVKVWVTIEILNYSKGRT